MTEMTEMLTPLGATPERGDVAVEAADTATRTPVLITEQQVLFGTAAAVPVRPAKAGHWWVEGLRIVGARVQAMFATSTVDARPSRRHYPPRNHWLERSCMSREMHRL